MKRIAELRREKHLTQVGLGLRLNVSQKMISAYESGIHQPSIDTLIEMSKIFDVSVDYILGLSDVRMPADKFFTGALTETEMKLLDMFKNLSKNGQQQALGILFTLKELENS